MRPFLPGPIPLCASIPPHAQPAEGALPFTSSWARKLMTVAGNHAIADRSHANDLPPDLETVFQLSLMTAPALEAAIEEGKVTPETTRAEAREIRREAEPEREKSRGWLLVGIQHSAA